jgi:signal transduction histidine kinase/ActR/RegA family two-component response regulator
MASSSRLPLLDDSVLDVLTVPACLCEGSSGRILRCNSEAIALWGQPVRTETRIHDVLRFVAPDGTPLPQNITPLATVVAERTAARNQQAVIDRPGSGAVRVSLHIAPVLSGGTNGPAGLLVFHNEPARERRESLLADQEGVLEMIARGAPLAGILDTLTAVVERHANGTALAAVTLLEPDGLHLHHVSGPGLPATLKAAIDELKVGPEVGTSQAAAFLREAVVTEDISQCPGWSALSRLPLRLGLRAAWSMPIISSSNRVLGTFDSYFRDQRAPSPEELEVVALLARTAAIAIERQQAADLACEADRRKDEFLAMLAHELRTPLAPIQTATQLLAFSERDKTIASRVRGVIERQVLNMTRLIDDLLDVSRITRGAVELQMVTVDVGRLIAHAVETALPLLQRRDHRLTVSVPPGPICISADSTRMEQAIVNLLANAAKFTSRGGDIKVRVEERADDIVAIHVADNGRGISKVLLPHVFEIFTQGSRSLDRADGGLGLGLTVAQRLVEMHGGSIEVKSDGAGWGSEFTIALPRSHGACVDAAEPAHANAAASRRIMIVEDQRDAAEMLAMLLTAQAHQVHIAADGHAALQSVGQFRPDIMLIDIGLPGMSGYDLAERIRRDQSLGHVLLVALTGYGGPDDRTRALECGFDHHVVKPIDEAALEELLRVTPSVPGIEPPADVDARVPGEIDERVR